MLIERHPYDRELIEGIYNLLIEVVLNQSEMMIISSQNYQRISKERFLKLNLSHIEYVMNSLQGNTIKVNNIKKYLLVHCSMHHQQYLAIIMQK